MTVRPDQRLIATSRIIENLAAKIALARINVRSQINAIGQIGGTSYDGSGRSGERTVLVDIECTGWVVCTKFGCATHAGLSGTSHQHPCRIDGEHMHKEAVPVTAVEDYAIRRNDLANQLADLEAHCTAITTIAANASRDADRLIGTHTPGLIIPRCTSKGRDGDIEWGDPTCTNIPTRGPLCDRCSKREYRWRLAHSLPSRRDGVFAGDLIEGVR